MESQIIYHILCQSCVLYLFIDPFMITPVTRIPFLSKASRAPLSRFHYPRNSGHITKFEGQVVYLLEPN